MLAAAGLLPPLDGNAIVTSRDAGADKPAPQIYRFAAGQVGLPIGQCLYVGEDAGEVAGAQAAGMAVSSRWHSGRGPAQPAIPSSRAAVPPRMAIRSSSVRPGVLSTRSTSVLVHGNG